MSRVNSFKDEIIKCRHDLHRHPEIAYGEVWTQKYIADVLSAHKIKCNTNFFKTAIIADIQGKNVGKTVALRADMDALNVTENSAGGGQPFSEIDGKMHACGHDFHMAALMGAAIWLNENKHQFSGTVRLIFQPAEEGTDPKDNLIDSSIGLIQAGVLNGVDAIFGMHMWPDLPFGTVGVCSDKCMAASDFFDVKITGQGGHISLPHLNKNPLYAAMEFSNNMLWLNSQCVSPFEPVIVGLGYLRSGSGNNIIPETAELGGGIRCFDESLRTKMQKQLEKFASTISEKYQVKCDLTYERGCSSTINDPACAEFYRNACAKVNGVKEVIAPSPAIGSENFGEFLKVVQGAFAWVGTNKDTKSSYGLHNPSFFAYDDSALMGAEIFIQTALDFLNK